MLPQSFLVFVDLATTDVWTDELLFTVFQVVVELIFGLERTRATGVWAVESRLNLNHSSSSSKEDSWF